MKLADLPNGVNFKQLSGVGLLDGLGFTMSLFIANRAYSNENLVAASKKGIVIGSLVVGILGYVVLRITLKQKSN